MNGPIRLTCNVDRSKPMLWRSVPMVSLVSHKKCFCETELRSHLICRITRLLSGFWGRAFEYEYNRFLDVWWKWQCLSTCVLTSDGRIHFHEDEKWSYSGSTGGWWLWTYKDFQSLVYVATHEVGHAALGLRHSDHGNSVMWPTADIGDPTLVSDDVSGINFL